jgi:hypothetical protein
MFYEYNKTHPTLLVTQDRPWSNKVWDITLVQGGAREFAKALSFKESNKIV